MSLSLGHGKQLDVGRYGIAQDDLPPMDDGRLDPRGWFVDAEGKHPGAGAGTGRPIELEIGSGKGTFLVQHAKLYPDVDYLGIEWAKAFWRYAADRARRHGLDNVRLLRCDAAVYVRHYVPDATFRQVHIYFPDPWPKKRHNKRRLIQADFLRELHRVLIPAPGSQQVTSVAASDTPGQSSGATSGVTSGVTSGGGETACVRIATDHADYFEWMGEHAAQVTDLFDREPFERPASAGEGELVGTNFERKYREEGRVFQGMILRKRP
jgi:tRNA (guanine-N7-)-methyltransferase